MFLFVFTKDQLVVGGLNGWSLIDVFTLAQPTLFAFHVSAQVQCICVRLARLVSSCREIRPSNLTSAIHFRARLLISCLFTPT